MQQINLSANLAISESGFLFLPTTGESFTVSEIGREILSGLQEGKAEAEIVKLITQHYEIDTATVERDLRDFLTQLVHFRLAGYLEDE